MSELTERNADAGINITATTKLRHAELWAAAKKAGSASALANQLGVHQGTLGRWINLQDVPKFGKKGQEWTEERRREFELKLFELTGKTLDELFPESLRRNTAFLNSPKTAEKTERVRSEAMDYYVEHQRDRQASIESHQERDLERLDYTEALKGSVERVLETLNYREREILKLRFGFAGDSPYTYEEIAKLFGVTRERIRQIEARAIRQLQQLKRSRKLVGYLND